MHLPYSTIISLLFCLLLSGTAWSQRMETVDSLLAERDYETALAQLAQLDTTDTPSAHWQYYQAQAMLGIHKLYFSPYGSGLIETDLLGAAELLRKLTRRQDSLWSPLAQQLRQTELLDALMAGADTYLSAAVQLPDSATTFRAEARQFLLAASSVSMKDYRLYHRMALINLEEGKQAATENKLKQANRLYLTAINYLNSGIQVLYRFQDSIPALQATDLFYRAAMLERYYLHPLNKELKSEIGTRNALRYLQRGKSYLENNFEKIKNMGLPDDQYLKYDVDYRNARADLHTMELDLLISNPELVASSFPVFASAAQQYPNNGYLQLAIADGLSTSDAMLAAEFYKKAIQLLPEDPLPAYQLAKMYVEHAKIMEKNIETLKEEGQKTALQQQIEQKYKQAGSYLEIARSLSPNSSKIQALLQQFPPTVTH